MCVCKFNEAPSQTCGRTWLIGVFSRKKEEMKRPSMRYDILIAVTMKATLFWIAYYSILKMEEVYSFKIWVSFYQTTQHHNLDDNNFRDSLVVWSTFPFI